MGRYVVGISGASGIILALRLIDVLTHQGHFIELTLTQPAIYAATLELGEQYSTSHKLLASFKKRELIRLHAAKDVGCALASGSFLTDGMIVIPCSMATLAALAVGLADNTLRRSADVTLKEKRPLILVPRETPISSIHLENMLKLSQNGATIVPPIPAWYIQPNSVQEIEQFIVGKVLDALKIDHTLYPRWGDL